MRFIETLTSLTSSENYLNKFVKKVEEVEVKFDMTSEFYLKAKFYRATVFLLLRVCVELFNVV